MWWRSGSQVLIDRSLPPPRAGWWWRRRPIGCTRANLHRPSGSSCEMHSIVLKSAPFLPSKWRSRPLLLHTKDFPAQAPVSKQEIRKGECQSLMHRFPPCNLCFNQHLQYTAKHTHQITSNIWPIFLFASNLNENRGAATT